MQTVLLVIYLMVVLALIGVVLIQRSEGGGLGIGGGSGFMSARGAANALTRTTAILATLFFVLALGMGILSRYEPSRPTFSTASRARPTTATAFSIRSAARRHRRRPRATTRFRPIPARRPTTDRRHQLRRQRRPRRRQPRLRPAQRQREPRPSRQRPVRTSRPVSKIWPQ